MNNEETFEQILLKFKEFFKENPAAFKKVLLSKIEVEDEELSFSLDGKRVCTALFLLNIVLSELFEKKIAIILEDDEPCEVTWISWPDYYEQLEENDSEEEIFS